MQKQEQGRYCYLCQYQVGGGFGDLRQFPHVALIEAQGGSIEGRSHSGIRRWWWGDVRLLIGRRASVRGLLEFVIRWATTAINGKRWRPATRDRRAAAPVGGVRRRKRSGLVVRRRWWR
jgi:hypothetical protein